MLAEPSMLKPVVALALWTHVIFVWMYATRLPAMRAMKIKSDPTAPRGTQMAALPARVRWKADNFNHLFEQPTVFYAVALVLAMIDTTGGANVTLAWIYVGLRVVHSLVQTVVGHVELRFVVFTLSAVTLVVMTINAARLLW
ncbi:MAG: MAPEG family protein [Deltaproteobacteria bacterium]|nr:MAPEG family protein [Deltaproteobacteria bacterium]